MANRNNVSIKVDKHFFDNVFETNRRSLEAKLGRTLSQTKFTAMCNKMHFRLREPKQARKYLPKRFSI